VTSRQSGAMKARPESLSAENSSGSERLPVARTVCLVGFMGAGKSSVGRALAGRFGCGFVDLDDRIEAREERSIAEIFRQSGEAEFRRAEHAALRDLLSELGSSTSVIALGGGAFVQADNARLLQQACIPSVFLDAPVEELFRRCQEQQLDRPLRRDPEQFRKLHEARWAGYMAAALRVETSGKDVETVAAEVANRLKSR
jgi:shikimate kinase